MIKSKNLSLRALENTDLPFLHKLYNDSRSMSYFFEEPYETLRELDDLFEKHIHNLSERRFVLENTNHESIGVLELVEIDEINRNCEIDIIIDEKQQGKGFGKEGFILGIKYAFDILNIFKVYLLVDPENLAGRKIYDYAGFKKEALLKKQYYVNGEYVDVLRMYLFKTTWKKHRSKFIKEFGLA